MWLLFLQHVKISEVVVYFHWWNLNRRRLTAGNRLLLNPCVSPLAWQFLFSYSTSWFPRKQSPDRRISESASEKLPNARPCLSCGLSQNNWSCSQGLGFLQASQCSQCRRLCKVRNIPRNVLNYVDKLWRLFKERNNLLPYIYTQNDQEPISLSCIISANVLMFTFSVSFKFNFSLINH